MLEGNVNVTLIPPDMRSDMLTQIMTAEQVTAPGGNPQAASASGATSLPSMVSSLSPPPPPPV